VLDVRQVLSSFHKSWVRYLAFILAPTLLVGLYEFVIAADMYRSEAKFGVKGLHQNVNAQGILGILSATGASKSTFDEALSLQDFFKSRDATKILQTRLNLYQIYRRPEADIIARLRHDPTAEDLDDYFRRMVDVRFDQQDGVTTIRAYAFRREDARAIVETLIEAGEQLINRYDERSREDALRFARSEVSQAEVRMESVLADLTKYRLRVDLIDPNQQGAVVLKLAADLQSQLLQTRAAIAESQAKFEPDSPRLQVLRGRERALQEQYDREYAKLTTESGSLAPIMADYEKLQLQRDFANRELEGALAALEAARLEAQQQQLYVVRVVDPVMPDEARFPRRWLIVCATAFVTMIVYGIVSLFVAGIRDHIV
jgi:capsular polysaccharide transport system permease protein